MGRCRREGSDAKKKIERLDVGVLVKSDGIIGTGGFGRGSGEGRWWDI